MGQQNFVYCLVERRYIVVVRQQLSDDFFSLLWCNLLLVQTIICVIRKWADLFLVHVE